MSLKKVHDNQPKDFKFSGENLKKANEILKRYPVKNKKSAPIKGKSIRDERIGKFIILILKKLEELKNQVTLQMRTGKYTRSEIYLL